MDTPVTYVDQVDELEKRWNDRTLHIDYDYYDGRTFGEWFNQLSNYSIVYHLRKL